MRFDESKRTFDCEPTLTDTQVLGVCRDGYILLDAVVPDEINQRTCEGRCVPRDGRAGMALAQ